MFRVARALVLHELQERLRDRWVLVITVLFALLSTGVTLYGRASGDAAAVVTAPSLVTLTTFLVPLVALVLGHDAIVGERERHTLGLLLSLPVSRGEVLLAKYGGRAIAMALAVGLGLGASALWMPSGSRHVLATLAGPTALLGLSFLSLGVLISAVAQRHATAASMAISAWFLLVFVYDLGLLAAMVATDGAVSQDLIVNLVAANPAGLYRTGLMLDLTGSAALEELGLAAQLPGLAGRATIWAAWILGPLAIGAALLGRRRAVTA